jgi:hypothetical protein
VSDFRALRSHLLAKSPNHISSAVYIGYLPLVIGATFLPIALPSTLVQFSKMSEYYANDKEVVPARPEAAVLSGEEKQVHSVAESTDNSDRQEPEQKGRMARMFTYMKTRDFWLVVLIGCVFYLDCANEKKQITDL